jgi:hypothetical protein
MDFLQNSNFTPGRAVSSRTGESDPTDPGGAIQNSRLFGEKVQLRYRRMSTNIEWHFIFL